MEPGKKQGDELEKQIPGKDVPQEAAQKPPLPDDVRRPIEEREREVQKRLDGELTEE